MSVTANLTTNVETITATIVVEDETIIAQVNTAARGPAGEPGAAGPNTLTTATTTNLTGFISGNGTNISGATAAATAATANTLVLRDANGGASLSTITLSGTGGSPFTSTLTGGVNFANRTLVLPDASGTLTTVESLANSATITASTAVAVDTIVLRDGAGVINITSSNVAGTTAYADTAGWTYAGSAAAAHRTALGLGTGDNVTFAGVSVGTNSSLVFVTGGSGNATGLTGNTGLTQPVWVVQSQGSKNRSGGYIGWSGSTSSGYGSMRCGLIDDDAQTIAQRNGTAAQESRIYGTYTSSSNYRRLALKMSNAGVAQIVAEGGGSGASGNRIEIDGLRIGKGRSDVATNTALGATTLNANTTGSSNTAVGLSALEDNTTGSSNTAVGRQSLTNNTTGSSNTAVGQLPLASNTTGSSNSAVGNAALRGNTTGSSNSAVGVNAGRYITDGTTANEITNNSVYLGANTKALASNQTNQIVIGFNAIGLGSNTAVLGNDSIATTALKGNVGIGTTSPAQKLDVVGSIKASGTIQTGGYTFDALPTPTAGMRAYITDGAASPAYMDNAAGGGTTVTPVFYDGTNWINA
jgi:hypothetical protein